PPTSATYTLSLHDALPIFRVLRVSGGELGVLRGWRLGIGRADRDVGRHFELPQSGFIHAEGFDDAGRHREGSLDAFVLYVERRADRKSTRLNSSHVAISYA